MTAVAEIAQEEGIVEQTQGEQTAKYIEKVRGIQEMLGRDRMKVAFYGRYVAGVPVPGSGIQGPYRALKVLKSLEFCWT